MTSPPPAQARSGPAVRSFAPLIVGLMLTTAMSMLDQSIMSTAGPTVVGELGGLNHYAWVFTAYALTFSVVMPLYGKLGDLLGRKTVYLFAITLFLLGSVACGSAHSMDQLIVFRAIQGVGGGGLQVTAIAILADLLPPRERAKYQGWFAGVMVLANLAGPLVGGLVTDQLGWRWVFFLNLPLGIGALTLISVLLPKGSRRADKPRIDYLGAALLTGSITAAILLTSWAGTTYGWGSATILGLAAGAVVALTLFVAVEQRVAEPIVPLRLFHNRTFTLCVAIAFIVSFGFFGCINFITLYFQLVGNKTATVAGLLFIPALVGLGVASILTGQFIARTGRYKWFPVTSTLLAAVGAYLLHTLGAHTNLAVAAGFLTFMGVGIGLSQQVTTLAAQNSAPFQDIGVATSTVGLSRNSAVSFGAAVFGALLNARLAVEAPRYLPPRFVGVVTSGQERGLNVGHLPVAVRHGFAEAYSHSLSTVFLWAVPVLLLGFVLSLFLPDVRLEKRGMGPGGGRPGGPGGPGGPGAAAAAPGGGQPVDAAAPVRQAPAGARIVGTPPAAPEPG